MPFIHLMERGREIAGEYPGMSRERRKVVVHGGDRRERVSLQHTDRPGEVGRIEGVNQVRR